MPIKVFIVDDHAIVRSGIRKLLAQTPDVHVVGEATSGEDALAIVTALSPDIVLMDMKLSGIDGLATTESILRKNPAIKIIALTSCNQGPIPYRFIQAGAKGYLTKDCSQETLLQAIRKVYAGERFLSHEIATFIALKTKNALIEKLSERELQVLMMIAEGQTAQGISKILGLSPKTVNTYRYRLFDKLDVSTDVELAHFAILYGVHKK